MLARGPDVVRGTISDSCALGSAASIRGAVTKHQGVHETGPSTSVGHIGKVGRVYGIVSRSPMAARDFSQRGSQADATMQGWSGVATSCLQRASRVGSLCLVASAEEIHCRTLFGS